MGMRRFKRLTNAFSKKLANHMHALSISCTTISCASIKRCDARPQWKLA
jgi:hypothetical protein